MGKCEGCGAEDVETVEKEGKNVCTKCAGAPAPEAPAEPAPEAPAAEAPAEEKKE